MPKRPSPKSLTGAGQDFGRYAGLGLQFVLTLVLLGALGWWLDSLWGTGPWLLVTGILLGSVVAFITIVRAVPPAKAVHVTKPALPPFHEEEQAEVEGDEGEHARDDHDSTPKR